MKLLKINSEYLALVPRPSKEEYAALEKDIIAKRGAIEPIKINPDNVILDGHTRFEICTKHTLHFDTVTMDLGSELDEKIYIMETNLLRRQMGVLSKAEVGGRLEPLYAERAKLRQESTRFGGVQMNTTIEETGKARDQAAKAAKLSPTTYHRAKTILDRGSPKLIQRVREGKTSVAYAYKTLRQEERSNEPKPLPQGVYTVVYADPPWEYDIMIRGAPRLTLLQRLHLRLTGRVRVGWMRRPGWRGELPFYAFRCPIHGIVVDYPHGHSGRLECPRCQGERTK
jgi:hypothetical protein